MENLCSKYGSERNEDKDAIDSVQNQLRLKNIKMESMSKETMDWKTKIAEKTHQLNKFITEKIELASQLVFSQEEAAKWKNEIDVL